MRMVSGVREAPESAETVTLRDRASSETGPDRELLLRAITSAACHASLRRMRTS